MGRARIASTFVLLLLAFALAVADVANNQSSSGGLFWATAKDESELLVKAEADEHDEFESGFSSLDGMLQWAIGIRVYVLWFIFIFLHIGFLLLIGLIVERVRVVCLDKIIPLFTWIWNLWCQNWWKPQDLGHQLWWKSRVLIPNIGSNWFSGILLWMAR